MTSIEEKRKFVELTITTGSVLSIVTAFLQFLHPTLFFLDIFSGGIILFVVAALRSYADLLAGKVDSFDYFISVLVMLGSFGVLLLSLTVVVFFSTTTPMTDPPTIFAFFLAYIAIGTFAVDTFFRRARRVLAKEVNEPKQASPPDSSNMATVDRIENRLKKVNWGKTASAIATLLTVLFAAVSAYYAYEAVQVALNPVTTVELGRGNFTSPIQNGIVSPQYYTTTEFRISAYRYVIVYPHFIVDTRSGFRGSSQFGPVQTDVVVDGVVKGTILYPAVVYGSTYGSVLDVVPRNVSTVTGLGLVTRTYCVGTCQIPNAEIFVRADLVR